jgi:hypothetical protein
MLIFGQSHFFGNIYISIIINYNGYLMDYTTIQLDKKLTKALKEVREHPRETYNETIGKLVAVYKKEKAKNQYDEFLHKIQQPKMKELWNNKEDEEWENV